MNRKHLSFVAAALVAVTTFTSDSASAAGGNPDPAGSVCRSYITTDQYPIRLCNKGDDVKTIQAALRYAGHSISVDGYFGPNTQRAVLTFQRQHGLTVDGLVGPRTWRALNTPLFASGTDVDGSGLVDPDESAYALHSPPPVAPPTPPPSTGCTRYIRDASYPLNKCDKGPAVRVAQLFLAELYAPLDIDGYFGPDTQQAVRNYQGEFGLTVDGLVGPRTWRALTAGFTCGTDSDRSGVIDPDEVALPKAYTHLAEFYDACTTR